MVHQRNPRRSRVAGSHGPEPSTKNRQVVRFDAFGAMLTLAADLERARSAPGAAAAGDFDTADEASLAAALRSAGRIAPGDTWRTVKSITVEATRGRPSMRIDLTVDALPQRSASIAGSYLLVVRAGRSAERLARNIRRVLRQIAGFGPDASSAIGPALVHEVELRIVRGYQLPRIQPYYLLTRGDERSSEAGPELGVTTWDAFVA